MLELSELERSISIRIIQEDAEAIYSLMQTEKNPIFQMEMAPYYVLFVKSYQEYTGEKIFPESIEKDLKDIRNHIKKYSESFGKSKRRVLLVDDVQNNDFREQLRFNFLKLLNIHLNLGSYWTNSRHIIGNTQQIADFLSIKSINDPESKNKCFQLGEQVGAIVSSLRNRFSALFESPVIMRTSDSVKIDYYYDINTSRKNKLFASDIPKELNLFFLHLLCNMNFIKYALRPLFTNENTWVFRIEYIVSYYTLRALERYKNYCENNCYIPVDTNMIMDILACGQKLFRTKLRNCMMHYSLENTGIITNENVDKPFYGIIECCFDGLSYQDYVVLLHDLSDKIIEYLEKQFDFSEVTLKQL